MTNALAFPSNINNGFRTIIRLREYSRPKPGSSVNVTTNSTIVLPLPTALQDSYNMEIANPAMDLLGNDPSQLYNAGKSATEEIVKEIKGGKSAISMMGEATLKALALTPGISDTGVSRLAQSYAGVVRNPHLTTIFEGVRLKVYQFTWKLAPQSEAEANTLNNLIKTLKMFMHPKISGGGFSLDYPYLATVEFTGINQIIAPNVKESFITGMQINGAGTGALAFYRDGQPVAIDLSLSFQEINIQTRDDITALSNGATGTAGIGITTAASTVSSSGNYGSTEMPSEADAYRI